MTVMATESEVGIGRIAVLVLLKSLGVQSPHHSGVAKTNATSIMTNNNMIQWSCMGIPMPFPRCYYVIFGVASSDHLT